MSEFTKLTTRLITPKPERKGFRKLGSFDRGATHDAAFYSRDDFEIRMTYAFHPYDHPAQGIRVEVCGPGGTILHRLHRPTGGGTEAMLRAVMKDLKPGTDESDDPTTAGCVSSDRSCLGD